MDLPLKKMLCTLVATCTLLVSSPLTGAETDSCAERLVELRFALTATTTEVTPGLVGAIGAALDACPGPATPQVGTPPAAPVGCTTPQHAEFANVPVDLTITVLGETRVFRDQADRATVNVYSGGHHSVDYAARGPTLGVYGDNSGYGAVFISFLVEDRGTGTAWATCGADGAVCSAYGQADFIGAFQMKVQSAASDGCA